MMTRKKDKAFTFTDTELLNALAEESDDPAWAIEDGDKTRALAVEAMAEVQVTDVRQLARLILDRQKRTEEEEKEKEDYAEFGRHQRKLAAEQERDGRFADRYNYDDYGVDYGTDSSEPPSPSSPTSMPKANRGYRDQSGRYVSQVRKNPVLCERLALALDALYVTARDQPYLVMSGALFELPQLFANSGQLNSCIRNDRTLTVALIQSYDEIKGRMLREYYEMHHHGREHALRYLDKMFEHIDVCLAAADLIAVGRHERQDVPPEVESLISSLRNSMQVRSMMHQFNHDRHHEDDDGYQW